MPGTCYILMLMDQQPQPIPPNPEPTATPAVPPTPAVTPPPPLPEVIPAPLPAAPPVAAIPESSLVPPPVSAAPETPFVPPSSTPALPPEIQELLNPAPIPEPEEPKTNLALSIGKAIFSWLAVPAMIVLALHFFVFQAFHVVGSSMVPNLHDADYLIITKLSATTAKISKKDYIPARGEVVVFRYPQNPDLVFVKRVVGIPGDRVVVSNGKVSVYNSAQPNGYNPDTQFLDPATVTLINTDTTVPAGHVFVMGDNRTPGGSFDSREWGPLPSEYIIGKAMLRLLPIDQLKSL